MIDLNSIYHNLNEIENSDKTLHAIVNFDTSSLCTTTQLEASSSLKFVGLFFEEIIIQQNLSSDKIEFFQRSFTLIKENKKIDQEIKIFKSFFSEINQSMEANSHYQSLLIEKDDGFQAEEKLQKLFDEKREKEITQNIDINVLFPEKKISIFEKLKHDLTLDEESLLKIFSVMKERTMIKAKTCIEQLIENSDQKAYKKLKQCVLGGVRFPENSKKVCYSVFDSPKTTAEKIQNKTIIEKTKTRINFPHMHGIKRIHYVTTENLLQESVPLNESSLIKALMLEINFYLYIPFQMLTDINECIHIYNWEPKKLNGLCESLEKFKEKIQVSMHYFLEECRKRPDDIDLKHNELIQKWNDCIIENQKLILKNKKKLEKNRLESNKDFFPKVLTELKPVPGILAQEDFPLIEMILRETIFETAELVKEKKIPAKEEILTLHNTLLKKLMEHELTSNKESIDMIEATIHYFFNKYPKTNYLLQRFFMSI